MVRYRYTPEALAQAAASARNITEVMRLLGVRVSGGSHAHISRQLKRFGIDTSHFTGQAHDRGVRRTTSAQLLVQMSEGSRRTPGVRLKRPSRHSACRRSAKRAGQGRSGEAHHWSCTSTTSTGTSSTTGHRICGFSARTATVRPRPSPSDGTGFAISPLPYPRRALTRNACTRQRLPSAGRQRGRRSSTCSPGSTRSS
ncbi:Protein of unknown function [Micromonospora lupini str. Lupac 08]|uniref:Uncharacterized protein n=1 Tax=Micromonospora lupini str. Lupac 08 TaxID=1150864 RepID=I0KXR6_9ACTN|nr:Protein of unknown function [Micromonospora lupini str. Lupac 08]